MAPENHMIVWYGADGRIINAMNALCMTYEEAGVLEEQERPTAARGHNLRRLEYMKQSHSITITATFRAEVPGVPSGALAAIMDAKASLAVQTSLSGIAEHLSGELMTLCKRYGVSEHVLGCWLEYSKKPLLDTDVDIR